MPYQQHDVDNAPVNPGTLLDRNAYERSVLEGGAPDAEQPGYDVATANSESWKDWNADYSKHGINGEDLNPDVPIEVATASTIAPPAGFPAGSSRLQEELTGTLATFTGGVGALTVEGAFICKPTSSNLRDALDEWTFCTPYAADATQIYEPTEADMDFAFVSRATDTEGTFIYSISEVDIHVYPRITITTQADYTGIKKVGQTLDIYNATAEGGLPPINYLIQMRFSETGNGGWTNNTNLATNLSPGEKVQYTIPDDQANKYIQFRARVRDNNGQGGGSVYMQLWSTAPDSSLQVADYLSETSGFGVALTGEFRVGQEIGIASIPVFAGGAPAVKYEYQWQKSLDGTNWVGFDSPWTEYDPATILVGGPTKTLNAPEEGYSIRVQTRATDKAGEQLIVQGIVYGPVTSESPAVFTETGVIAPLGLLEGAYRVGEVVNATAATFTGGAQPVTRQVDVIQTIVGKTTSEVIASFDETDIANGSLLYTLQHNQEAKLISVMTTATDAEGNMTASPIALFDQTGGQVLPFEPEMELVSPTEIYGLATPGNTLRVRCAQYSGGMAPQKYHVLLRASDTPTGAYEQTTIKANATPGDFYDVPITLDHLNKYLTILTRVADNNRDPEGGYKQKFNIVELGYPVTIPSSPKPSGPRYDYDGYEADLYAEPNYKQGQVLRVGDTVTMTAPDFFGGPQPYRYDLSYFLIYAKKGGTSTEVYRSAPGVSPGQSVTYTIPQSLLGDFIKVNYYLYDSTLHSHKFSFNMYNGNPPNSYLEGVIGPAL